jgi:hypothetical protein
MSESDDDRRWVDSLAGLQPGTDRASREGFRLREALLARREKGAASDQPATSLAREERLLSIARREQLIPRRGLVAGVSTWVALAASLAVVVTGAFWLLPQPPDAEVVRGTVDGTIRVEVRKPAAAQMRLLSDLRAVGITGRGYQMLGRFGVDADWPVDSTPEQRAVLQQWRLTAPTAGESLRVEFSDPAP